MWQPLIDMNWTGRSDLSTFGEILLLRFNSPLRSQRAKRWISHVGRLTKSSLWPEKGAKSLSKQKNKQKEISRNTKQHPRFSGYFFSHDTIEGKCARLFLVLGEVLRILEWGFGNKEGGGDSRKMVKGIFVLRTTYKTLFVRQGPRGWDWLLWRAH